MRFSAYVFAIIAIFSVSFLHTGQIPVPFPSSPSGIPKIPAPTASSIARPHSRTPHHGILTIPLEIFSFTSSMVVHAIKRPSRDPCAFLNRLSWIVSNRFSISLSISIKGTFSLFPVSLLTTVAALFLRSRGPISTLSGTPFISHL